MLLEVVVLHISYTRKGTKSLDGTSEHPAGWADPIQILRGNGFAIRPNVPLIGG
jgi:hypothetical protein